MKIEIKEITKVYGEKAAVNNLNLTLNEGVYALLGANGSGKTTFMRMLADVLRPTKGEIRFNGNKISELGGEYRNIIGYLPQNFGYYKDFTAEDFLMYFCALKGINGSYRKKRCEEMLRYVDLYDVRKKKIKTFSGGMRQRLGIAQALLNNPYVLILDEPTAGLDPKERIRFRTLMTEMSRERIVLYATHIVSDISYIADKVLIMKQGSIVANGTIKELTDSIDGKVWQLSCNKESLSTITQNYVVGDVVSEGDNEVRLRLISHTKPCDAAQIVKADLNDVYLSFFGEAIQNDSYNKI